MNLQELMEKAVTLPLTVEMERISEILWEPTIYQRNARPDRQWVADLPTWSSETPPPLAVLIVHCVNNFAQVVEALEKLRDAAKTVRAQTSITRITDGLADGVMKADRALAAAQAIPSGEKEGQ